MSLLCHTLTAARRAVTATATYVAATPVHEAASRSAAAGAGPGASPTGSGGVRARVAASRMKVRAVGAPDDASAAEVAATLVWIRTMPTVT